MEQIVLNFDASEFDGYENCREYLNRCTQTCGPTLTASWLRPNRIRQWLFISFGRQMARSEE